ncbi:pro-corazonin [Bombyx mandarina]|uniref:Pro-corazonin n=3 Tax=Bombyx TaxID=7090 RepID=CORZ_BOMMO|nr:pro-corazonin precursor [Bombyx mori]XP_028031772.1 pro-corazonin [Bombyx mandarina]Q86N75.1 RecName: Full=Pro-corazonin; Short=BmCrz; Short=Crz; Contains: RecName: Full=Corazonin; Contains: RecName: Full=Corazonin precursor-related peptide; Short=CPRP; Flags: Precursor [Bombyx mori]BAC66443.1 corazonin preprohormone [Bombyx mori]
MVTNITLILTLMTLASVTAQTFQYSRGWTNGKRDGHKRDELRDEVLERILTPCQLDKLKYVLEGKPLNDRLFVPCDYIEEEVNQPKRYKGERNHELFDVFQ